MSQCDATSAECYIYTFKEGLLSKMAHDLKIKVTGFKIDYDEGSKSLSARFDAKSLRVECCMKDGVESPGTLSDSDKGKIAKEIVSKVLHADEYPEIVFSADNVGESGVAGTLTLHGVEQPVSGRASRSDGKMQAEFMLHQPDFGIKPFSAMMGTLKVKPDVTIKVAIPG